MKAKQLIKLLESDPEAEVMVSIARYYENTFQDAGYKRSEYQRVTGVTMESKKIKINGGNIGKL